MSDSQQDRSRNPAVSYTSFDQFLSQNDFSQFNNPYYNNPYAAQQQSYNQIQPHQHYYYQPLLPNNTPTPVAAFNAAQQSFTLTASASEFVPRSLEQDDKAKEPRPPIQDRGGSSTENSHRSRRTNGSAKEGKGQHDPSPPTLDNLTLTDTAVNGSATGAVPKQHSEGRGNRNSKQASSSNNNSSRRQNQHKNQKSDWRSDFHSGPSNTDTGDYSQWNNGMYNEPLQNGHNHQQGNHYNNGRNHANHHHNEGRGNQYNRSYWGNPPESNGSNWNSNTSNNHNNHRNDRKNKQSHTAPLPSIESKRRPTDYQSNRNLKRPDRSLDLPSDISQREKQIVEIDAGQLECLVCCETIKPFQSTWCCKNCYHILHLNCTIKWATRSKSDDGWRCPACQNLSLEVPRDYFCFCEKQKNPQYNRNDVAHSCGELCGRQTGCDHPCTLLCHPGACPTCQASVQRKCGCGVTTKTLLCSQDEQVVCDGICEKSRNCGIHKCENKCHQGDCPDCEETLEHECYCGKNKKDVPCTADNLADMKFSCASVCEKELSCQNHKCQRLCHRDECRECDLTVDKVKTCPCGKQPILKGERTSCLDEIPLCGAVCNKIFSCGAPSNPHRCIAKCHQGPCPPCQKSTAVKCRCGQMDQMVKCKQLTTRADDARCKKKCPKKRSCGKHKCNLECCIDIDHICPLPCTSTLSCGKHKCEKTCHPGHCLPCQRASFQELLCECGAQVIYPPVPCGTKRPACDKPCTRRHTCDHQVLHNCHTMATCPPCMMQTAQYCFGKHEQRRTIPCSQESFGCGMPCNKELPCKRHKCIKSCHEGECMQPREVCKQSCVLPRPICGHKCLAPCHEGDCPETMCKETVEVVCQCGNRKQNRMCHDFSNDYKRMTTAQLASSLQDMQSGASNSLKDIFGPIKWTTAKKIECDDNCEILERNRRMAIGLQIRNPDLNSKLLTKYSDYLKNWAKDDPHFIEGIHDTLTKLVTLAKESKQKFRVHSFPCMNREKRHAVHEMCEMFGVDSKAYDAEPNRNIVATAHKERSWLPAQSIMDVLRRESGIRRVPGPAWGVKRT